MSDILQTLRPYLEGPISFKAQKQTAGLSLLLLNIGAFVSFAVGFISQDLMLGIYSFVASTVLTLLVVVPPWPAYQGEQLKWLEPKIDILQ